MTDHLTQAEIQALGLARRLLAIDDQVQLLNNDKSRLYAEASACGIGRVALRGLAGRLRDERRA